MNLFKEKILNLIKNIVSKDNRIIFAYVYGSFVKEEKFRDIDIGIYVNDPNKNLFEITSELKTQLSTMAKDEKIDLYADQFDVRVINDAPFTFLNRVFKAGILLVDRNPDLRTDIIEAVSIKYRECAGLLKEASLI